MTRDPYLHPALTDSLPRRPRSPTRPRPRIASVRPLPVPVQRVGRRVPWSSVLAAVLAAALMAWAGWIVADVATAPDVVVHR